MSRENRDEPTAWQPGLDSQAQAWRATHNWVYRSEALWREDLFRRMHLLRQTMWASARWDTINDAPSRNSGKKRGENDH